MEDGRKTHEREKKGEDDETTHCLMKHHPVSRSSGDGTILCASCTCYVICGI